MILETERILVVRPPSFLEGMGMPLRRCLSDDDADDGDGVEVAACVGGDDAVSDDDDVVIDDKDICSAFPCWGNIVDAALVARMMDLHDAITFRLETVEEDDSVLMPSLYVN
jgi:hypothetical protein